MSNETATVLKIPASTSGPIPRALTLLGVTAAAPRVAKKDITTQLRRVRNFRTTAETTLLPIEQPAALRVLDRKVNALENGSLGYQRIPTDKLREVLGWRNTDGMPTLAPFSITKDTIEFVANPWEPMTVHPALPRPLAGCYGDVSAKLQGRARARQARITATARFDGMIPADVRRVIVGAQERFKDIRILAEVDRWKIEETEIPSLRTDPFVIGYDGEDFWLLATFDITPLEEAVRKICTGEAPTDS